MSALLLAPQPGSPGIRRVKSSQGAGLRSTFFLNLKLKILPVYFCLDTFCNLHKKVVTRFELSVSGKV